MTSRTPTSICRDCRHRRDGYDPTPFRGSRLHFDICATQPITRAAIDPVTGVQLDMDRGTACARLNHDGRCKSFEPKPLATEPAAAIFAVVATVVILIIAVVLFVTEVLP